MKNENIPVCLSIGIIARNGEHSIKTTLESLFQQSVFAKLRACNGRCEIVCIACGCTDQTAGIAHEVFERMERSHAHAPAFTARVMAVAEAAGTHAWNLFVHELSAPESPYLFVMDDDTTFYDADIIYTLAGTLARNPAANVSAGSRHTDVLFKPRRIALAIPGTTGGYGRRADGQLYCMRASVARRIHPPRDPGQVDDGFLRAAFCTDFFTHPPDASRIIFVPDGAPAIPVHVPPRTPRPAAAAVGRAPAESSRRRERRDQDGRKKSSRRPVPARFFQRFFPGLLAFPFRRLWRRQQSRRKAIHLPALPAGFAARSPGGGPLDP